MEITEMVPLLGIGDRKYQLPSLLVGDLLYSSIKPMNRYVSIVVVAFVFVFFLR
jgi:hypothetical protein